MRPERLVMVFLGAWLMAFWAAINFTTERGIILRSTLAIRALVFAAGVTLLVGAWHE